jgi:hypothetical protein
MRTKFLDPIHPSAAAWYHFDNALDAYQRCIVKHSRDYHYKRYHNQRYKMQHSLRKAGASESLIIEWLESLKQQCILPPSSRQD